MKPPVIIRPTEAPRPAAGGAGRLKRRYDQPNPELRKHGVSCPERLIEALCVRDAETARAAMRAPMRAARRMMLAREARVIGEFLSAREGR